MTPLQQFMATLAVALIAASGTWFTLRINRPKIVAERDSVIASTALSLLDPLNDRIALLSSQIDDLIDTAADNTDRISSLEEELGMVRLWAQVLWRQVVELGGDPIPFEQIEAAWVSDDS